MPILNLDMIPILKSFTKKKNRIIAIFYIMQLHTYAYIHMHTYNFISALFKVARNMSVVNSIYKKEIISK